MIGISEVASKATEVSSKSMEQKTSFDPDKRIEPGNQGEVKNAVAEKASYDPDKRVDVAKAGETAENKETEKKGGSYGELRSEGHGWNHNPPEEVHHMPANEANGLETYDGPAIVMDKEDHRRTASCGNSLEAREYRAKQAELIKEGKFEEAMQMDIDDIHEKFGDKYDDAIAEMKEYAKEKGYI